jgi:hypothetical protein
MEKPSNRWFAIPRCVRRRLEKQRQAVCKKQWFDGQSDEWISSYDYDDDDHVGLCYDRDPSDRVHGI